MTKRSGGLNSGVSDVSDTTQEALMQREREPVPEPDQEPQVTPACAALETQAQQGSKKSKYGTQARKLVLQRINELGATAHAEIFRMLNREHVDYTKNKNGMFVNLSVIDDKLMDDIVTFVDYCIDNNKILEEYDKKLDDIRKNNNSASSYFLYETSDTTKNGCGDKDGALAPAEPRTTKAEKEVDDKNERGGRQYGSADDSVYDGSRPSPSSSNTVNETTLAAPQRNATMNRRRPTRPTTRSPSSMISDTNAETRAAGSGEATASAEAEIEAPYALDEAANGSVEPICPEKQFDAERKNQGRGRHRNCCPQKTASNIDGTAIPARRAQDNGGGKRSAKREEGGEGHLDKEDDDEGADDARSRVSDTAFNEEEAGVITKLKTSLPSDFDKLARRRVNTKFAMAKKKFAKKKNSDRRSGPATTNACSVSSVSSSAKEGNAGGGGGIPVASGEMSPEPYLIEV